MSPEQKDRYIEMLTAMIGDISNAIGISEEDQACANGSEEIVFAIEELKQAAASLAVERAEFRREAEALRASVAELEAKVAQADRVPEVLVAEVAAPWGVDEMVRPGRLHAINQLRAILSTTDTEGRKDE